MKTFRAKAVSLAGRVTGVVVLLYGWTKATQAYDDLHFYAVALAGDSPTTPAYAANMVRQAPESIHHFGLYMVLGMALMAACDVLARKLDS